MLRPFYNPGLVVALGSGIFLLNQKSYKKMVSLEAQSSKEGTSSKSVVFAKYIHEININAYFVGNDIGTFDS
jgi:hypothetical protein